MLKTKCKQTYYQLICNINHTKNGKTDGNKYAH